MGVLQALTSVAFGFHGDAPISSAVSITSAHLCPPLSSERRVLIHTPKDVIKVHEQGRNEQVDA